MTKRENIIFLASIVVKLAMFFLILFFGMEGSSAFDDSDGYYPLAVNLYQYGVFSYQNTPPFSPEVVHAPGYPFFLSLFAAPFSSVIPAVLIQIVLASLGAILLYRFLGGVFPDNVRFWGVLLYAIEPWNAYSASSVLSESIFVFLLITTLYLARTAWQKDRALYWIISGVFLGAAAYIRPIALYLGLLGGVFVLVMHYWNSRIFLKSAGRAVLFLGAFCLVISFWSFRNYERFGSWSFSMKGPFTLYFYNVQQLLIYKEGISAGESAGRLFEMAKISHPEIQERDDLRHPKYAPYLYKASREIITGDPITFAKMYFLSIGTFFLSDGYRLLLKSLFPAWQSQLPNITLLVANADISGILNYLKISGLNGLVLLIGLFFWGSVTLLSALAFPISFLKKEASHLRIIVVLLIGLILYFALLTGPVAQARYRVPITPFLFILATYSAFYFYKRCVERGHMGSYTT